MPRLYGPQHIELVLESNNLSPPPITRPVSILSSLSKN